MRMESSTDVAEKSLIVSYLVMIIVRDLNEKKVA
jgi:hypothetical protein